LNSPKNELRRIEENNNNNNSENNNASDIQLDPAEKKKMYVHGFLQK